MWRLITKEGRKGRGARGAEKLSGGGRCGYGATMRSGIGLTRGACPWRRLLGPWALALAGAAALIAPGRAAAEPTKLPPQEAYSYGENETARIAAFGGALRALGNGTASLFVNPSAMAESRVYHLEALAQVSPEARRQVYGGAVVDSITGRLAGGLSVVGGFIDPDGIDRSFLDARIALAYPISERFFVGLSGRYAKIHQDNTLKEGGLGASDVSGGLVDPDGGRLALVNEVTFDAAVTVKVADTVHLAVVGQNLTYPNNGLLPTTLGGGVGVGTSDFSIEGDGVADFNSYSETTARLMVGAEYLAADHFPIRLGYRFDQGAEQHSISGGLGYVGAEFAVEAAVRRALSDPGATTVVFGLSYHLESTGLTRATTDF